MTLTGESTLVRTAQLLLEKRISLAQAHRDLQAHEECRYTELAQAIRDYLKGGKHPGNCRYDLPDGACSLHVQTFYLRHDRLVESLAKLESD